jgi:hypothetical protein
MTLVAVSDGDPEADVQQTWLNIRDLTQGEVEAVREATALFRDLLEDSPLADLKTTAGDLQASVENYICDERWPYSSGHQEVRRRFKSWLGALRTFDDRTSHWISTTFGDTHPAYGAFKARLSNEYDNNFAYRFACALRNVSEHVSQTINVMRAGSSELPDGRSRRTLEIGFNRDLAADLKTLKAQVRDELAACEGVLGLETVVGYAVASCERAYGSAVLALWPDLEQRLAVVEGLHREATGRGGAIARAVDLDVMATGRMDVVEVRDDHARLLRNVKEQVSALLAVPDAVMGARDLVGRSTITVTL